MRSTTQSPMSPPPAKRMKASVEKCNNGGGLSVLEMFNRRVAKEHSKKVSALMQGPSLVTKTFSTN